MMKHSELALARNSSTLQQNMPGKTSGQRYTQIFGALVAVCLLALLVFSQVPWPMGHLKRVILHHVTMVQDARHIEHNTSSSALRGDLNYNIFSKTGLASTATKTSYSQMSTSTKTSSNSPMSTSTKKSRYSSMSTSTKTSYSSMSTSTKTTYSTGTAYSSSTVSSGRKLCKTPHFDPFDKSVMSYYHKIDKALDCEPGTHLISEVNEQGYLTLHADRLHRLAGKNKANCSFVSVVRDNDNKRVYSHPQYITPGETKKVNSDFTRVSCYDNHDKLLYINLHGHIPTNKRRVQQKLLIRTDAEQFSVLMIGFDGMSMANTIRTMPKTYEYLTKTMGTVPMKGYNTVGENTYPNLVPLLCGRNRSEIPTIKGRVPLEFPFVWKKFSENNYTTLYTEDEFYATFNYLTSGFTKAPTDYYQRPFWEEFDAIGKTRGKNEMKKFKEHCFNGKSIHELMFDWVRSFAKKFHNSPYFVFTFLNHLSHYYINPIQVADDYFLGFFRELYENGHLDNTVTFFMSDHGNRYSSMRKSPIGRAEHALPLMAIHFPEKFRKHHPAAFDAIKNNADRLTTPFDIHSTLLDILANNFSSRRYENDARGLSLFGVIPDERECISSGVPEEFCRCDEQVEINTKSVKARLATHAALSHVQSLLKPQGKKCQHLELNKINSAFASLDSSKPGNVTRVLVVFETLPGKALFEATVKLPSDVSKSQVVGNVARINKYGDQSLCMTDKFLRNYCYCKGYKGD